MRTNEWFDHVLNGLLALVLIGAILLPGSPFRGALSSWIADREFNRKAEELWPQLQDSTSRLDQGIRPVGLVVFGDYECVFCRDTHPHVSAVSGGDPPVGIAYRHLVLRKGSAAEGAALAAVCAEQQGRLKDMNTLLYETEAWLVEQDWYALAVEAELGSLDDFQRCHAGEWARTRLAEDMALAEALGVRGTPTIVYQGGRHVGLADPQQLGDLMQRATASLSGR